MHSHTKYGCKIYVYCVSLSKQCSEVGNIIKHTHQHGAAQLLIVGLEGEPNHIQMIKSQLPGVQWVVPPYCMVQ